MSHTVGADKSSPSGPDPHAPTMSEASPAPGINGIMICRAAATGLSRAAYAFEEFLHLSDFGSAIADLAVNLIGSD